MVKQEWLLTDEEIAEFVNDTLAEDWEKGQYICEAQLAKAEPLIRKDEREKYNEAVALAVDVAGLKQSLFATEDILGLAERAEEILQALKGERS